VLLLSLTIIYIPGREKKKKKGYLNGKEKRRRKGLHADERVKMLGVGRGVLGLLEFP